MERVYSETGRVEATRRIEQSPLSNAPSVPRRAVGFIQDDIDGYLFVDFDGPYGVVCCEYSDVR